MTHPNNRPDKKAHRLIVERQCFTSTHHGHYWLLKLDCRHTVKLHNDRGSTAKKTHCEKCSLGLVAA